MRDQFSSELRSIWLNFIILLVAFAFFVSGIDEAIFLSHIDKGSFLLLCAIFLQLGYESPNLKG